MPVLISPSVVSFSFLSGFLAPSPETIQLVDDQMETNDTKVRIADRHNPRSTSLEKVNFCLVGSSWEMFLSWRNPVSSEL